jgi:hypothetical protein
MFNLANDFGAEVAKDYASLFTQPERDQMYIMNQYIMSIGVDAAKKAVTRGVEFDGYDAAID